MTTRPRVSAKAGAAIRTPTRRAPNKLNVDLIQRFADLIERGHTFDSVCDYNEIAQHTFYDWIRRGEQYNAAEDGGNPEDELCGLFVRTIRRAAAAYRIARLDELHRVGNRNWFRDLCILERRDRKNFSRTEPSGGGDDAYTPDEKFM